jgi:hypothetical protein
MDYDFKTRVTGGSRSPLGYPPFSIQFRNSVRSFLERSIHADGFHS